MFTMFTVVHGFFVKPIYEKYICDFCFLRVLYIFFSYIEIFSKNREHREQGLKIVDIIMFFPFTLLFTNYKQTVNNDNI